MEAAVHAAGRFHPAAGVAGGCLRAERPDCRAVLFRPLTANPGVPVLDVAIAAPPALQGSPGRGQGSGAVPEPGAVD